MIGVDDSVDHDRYAHALEQLVDAVVAGDEPAEPPQPEPAVGLMTRCSRALRRHDPPGIPRSIPRRPTGRACK